MVSHASQDCANYDIDIAKLQKLYKDAQISENSQFWPRGMGLENPHFWPNASQDFQRMT